MYFNVIGIMLSSCSNNIYEKHFLLLTVRFGRHYVLWQLVTWFHSGYHRLKIEVRFYFPLTMESPLNVSSVEVIAVVVVVYGVLQKWTVPKYRIKMLVNRVTSQTSHLSSNDSNFH